MDVPRISTHTVMREACRHDGRVALEHRIAQASWMRELDSGEICLVGSPEPGPGDAVEGTGRA